jgi:acyl-CoA thioesterase-1
MSSKSPVFYITICLVVSIVICILWYTLFWKFMFSENSSNSWSNTLHTDQEISSTSDASSRCTIIAVGDSITAGYNLDPKDAFPAQLEQILRKNNYPCTVINGGVSGDTSKNLLDRLDFTLGDSEFTLAILTIGGNDGLRNLPITDLSANIIAVIKKLQKKNIPVLLTGMQIPNNAWMYAKEFREIYPKIAEEMRTPLLPFFLEWVAMNQEYNLSDRIHPNVRGYEVIANNIFKFLRDENLLNIPKNR